MIRTVYPVPVRCVVKALSPGVKKLSPFPNHMTTGVFAGICMRWPTIIGSGLRLHNDASGRGVVSISIVAVGVHGIQPMVGI